MAKATSAEIGKKRYYHHVPPGKPPCACGDRIQPDCHYSLLSVTTILDVLPKPWLGPWAAKIVAQSALDELAALAERVEREGRKPVEDWLKQSPWRKRDAAAERGTATHTAAELGTAAGEAPESVRGKVAAWHAWLDDYQPTLERQEVTVYSPGEGYAGTADLFAYIDTPSIDERWHGRWLIDIKTGSMSWSHRLQQAAYRFGEFIGDERGSFVERVPAVDHVGILAIRDDGYSLWEIKAGGDEYDGFRLAARFARMVDDLSRDKDVLVGESQP